MVRRKLDYIFLFFALGRNYVQPQWIFDSINRRQLLPMHKYFPGEILPPHLSPFMKDERRIGDYVPPEEKKLGLDDEKMGEDEQTEVLKSDSDCDSKSDEMDSEANDGEESKEEECEDEGDRNMSVVEGKPQNLNKGEYKRLKSTSQTL